ncbi:TPA: hypothetical protein U1D01_001062 [Streptococcus suis]|nr:hypothetical protein [Streptococcus suis]
MEPAYVYHEGNLYYRFLGFSVAKNYISIAPEAVTMAIFTNDIKAANY